MSPTTFVDPREELVPSAIERMTRTSTDVEELTELHRLCREGRLYDIERWMLPGRPLQAAKDALTKSRITSALEIALEAENQAMVLLLLCNGYDPNLERQSPFDLAFRARRWDLVDLLLEWGTDPHDADLADLFGTYNSKLFERFRALGVDLTAGHELAEALAYHTSNKPLFGFAKRHRKQNPRIQTELNIALAHHASEGSERGVALCLWAGADAHAPAPDLRDPVDSDADDDENTSEAEDRSVGCSAIELACRRGDARMLERLGPDPIQDDFDELYRAAGNAAVVRHLACHTLPSDADAVVRSHLWWATFAFRFDTWGSMDALRCLFELGVRWTECSKEDGWVRRWLTKTSDPVFVDVMKLLATKDYCATDVLVELARTPAMRRRMQDVGFIPADESSSATRPSAQPRPTRSREVLKKFGVVPKKPNRGRSPQAGSSAASRRRRGGPTHTVEIGPQRPDGREIRLDRASLFDRVWSEPVVTLAKKWGLSDRGLSKACRRLQVPVPPRGYWAKVNAGQKTRRPRLPKLQAGEAEVIVVWESE